MGWDEFDYCARHVDGGAFTLTMHPEVIGRGPRIAMLDRLVARMKDTPGRTVLAHERDGRALQPFSPEGVS